jgi:diguanylate cyclase (GGDEF)-like protein
MVIQVRRVVRAPLRALSSVSPVGIRTRSTRRKIVVNSETTVTVDLVRAAQETGFKQGVQAMRRTLSTTPIGWILVAWICWGRVPHGLLLGWLGLFLTNWTLAQILLRWIIRSGSNTARHSSWAMGAAVLDGAAWGLMFSMLTGHDPMLDAWLGAVLAGVAAVNAPIYITIPRCFRVLLGAMWLGAVPALMRDPGRLSVVQTFVGLSVFMTLLSFYMKSIAQRVLEGIRLQLANQALTEQLRHALQLVEQDAVTDALTGQPNRRALDLLLEQQVALAERSTQPFSLLMLDIDHFKPINDRHGHGVGDAALKAFALRVRELLRAGDVCARFGGEEFVVVLPATALLAAIDIAERLRQAVADTALLVEPPLTVTVSIGAAEFSKGLTPQQLLNMADEAVYAAKKNGRNQVRAYSLAPSDAPDMRVVAHDTP